jgi:hypothetical protein
MGYSSFQALISVCPGIVLEHLSGFFVEEAFSVSFELFTL